MLDKLPSRYRAFEQCNAFRKNWANLPNVTGSFEITNTTRRLSWTPTPFLIFRELELGKNFGLLAPLITSMGPDCVAISECGRCCKKWRVSKILALSPLT